MSATAEVARRFRNLRRLQQILGAFVRHGFGDIVCRLGLDGLLRSSRKPASGEGEVAEGDDATGRLSVEARIRMICESLGPTFIKLGQVMATRPDLVPATWILELSKLHDDVPPFPFADVRRVVEEELGAPLEELFRDFEEESLAAASIAQVHRATLPDGRPVVVKVQRPDLAHLIDTDLDILRGLAERLEEYVEEARTFRPRAVVDEFARALHEEIDFQRELESMQRYGQLFSESEIVAVPEGYPELCSARVITMERMEGFKLTDRAALEESGLDAMALARNGTLILMQSVFEHGFFHADPHPGNFLVRDDGVICVLDFGLMGELDGRRTDELLGFLVAVLLNDPDMLISQLQEMEILDESRDPRRLRTEMARLLNRFQDVKLGDIAAADVIGRVLDLIRGEDVNLPTDLILIIKSVGTVEGIATEICPEFQPLDEVRPYLVAVYTKRALDPRQQSKVVARTMADAVSLLRTLPRDLRMVLRKINRGEVRVETRAVDGEADRAQRDRAVNRVVVGLLLCATMVLTTVLLYYPPGDGTPWAGYIGLVVSAVVLIGLLWSVIRSKGL